MLKSFISRLQTVNQLTPSLSEPMTEGWILGPPLLLELNLNLRSALPSIVSLKTLEEGGVQG